MRNFDAEIAAELAKDIVREFFMLELQLTDTQRMNDTEINIYDDTGNLFVPVSFSFQDIKGSSAMAVDSIDIEIDDADQGISAILLNEDVRNKVAILYYGIFAAVSENQAVPIVNGNFSTALGAEWELTPGAGGGTITIVSGKLRFTQGVSAWMYASQSIATVIGDVYTVTANLSLCEYGNYAGIKIGTTKNASDVSNPAWYTTTGAKTVIFTATSTTTWITLVDGAGTSFKSEWDDVDCTRAATPIKMFSQEYWRGIIAGWELSEDSKATITLKNEFVLWSKKTLRPQSSSCPWVFKGTECGYTGKGAWCDQSYERCVDLDNVPSFAGNRFLPSIMGKEIWWGRNASV